MDVQFRSMQAADWPAVSLIYFEGMATGNATFQKEIPGWDEWDSGHLKTCRIIGLVGDKIFGWAALSPVSDRCVYAGVAEISVYVAGAFRGIGLGKKLLEKLVSESEAENIWVLQAGIFPENFPSLELHRRAGFREVGYREKIGKMDGRWRNIILMERRSEIAGID